MSENGTEAKVNMCFFYCLMNTGFYGNLYTVYKREKKLKCQNLPTGCFIIYLLLLVAEFMFNDWKNQCRKERDSEFAPPSAYFNDDKKQRPGKSQIQPRFRSIQVYLS